jgi:hypothetical protein
MKFVPNQPERKVVPYFEDATKSDGYGGRSTTKDIRTLRSEVTQAISRLGGTVIDFMAGKFIDETDPKRTRPGFSISYTQAGPNGISMPGRIDFAGLPCRNPSNIQKSEKTALWMVARAFEAMFYFEQMAPGYSTLMPFMLGKDGKTVFELWGTQFALPSPMHQQDEEIVEGELS